MAKLNIVLYEPEIPANTGNIGRTCVATGTKLHLIEPLGFSLSEKALKRAGMDYWSQLEVERYVNYEDFLQRNPGAKIYMATTKAKKIYSEASRTGLLYHVRQGECGNSGGDIGRTSGGVRAYSDDRRDTFFESL